MTPAARCRRNGWAVGTRLRGIERGENWSSVVVIAITAIGEEEILAKMIEEDGDTNLLTHEDTWSLDSRRWRRVR